MLDESEQEAMAETFQYALEYNKTNEASAWVNPDTDRSGSLVPLRTFQTSSGQYCREFITTILIGGEPQQGYGTACRQPDGSWQIVSGEGKIVPETRPTVVEKHHIVYPYGYHDWYYRYPYWVWDPFHPRIFFSFNVIHFVGHRHFTVHHFHGKKFSHSHRHSGAKVIVTPRHHDRHIHHGGVRQERLRDDRRGRGSDDMWKSRDDRRGRGSDDGRQFRDDRHGRGSDDVRQWRWDDRSGRGGDERRWEHRGGGRGGHGGRVSGWEGGRSWRR